MKKRYLIEGDKVFLRYVEERDTEWMYEVINDKEFRRKYEQGREPTTKETLRERNKERNEEMRNANATGFTFVVVEKGENKEIGTVSMNNIDWNSGNGELGLAIHDRSYWDLEYEKDAARAVMKHFFFSRRLHRIQVCLNSGNKKAVAECKELGFVEEGTMKDFYFQDGRFQDVVVLGILDAEFKARMG